MGASEKTPVLFANKMPFESDTPKRQCSSKSMLGWIFVTILVLLLIVLIAQFFFSPFDKVIRLYEEQPIDVLADHPKSQTPIITENKVNSADPWDLNFLIDPSDLCATHNPPDSEQYAADPEVKLLMLVPSAVDHFEQRRAIRNTWGLIAEKPFGPIRLAFIVGTTTNRTVDDRVEEESSLYKDIIQADIQDGDHSQTIKSILMFKWVAKRCPHAQYFLKADDDTFVNLGNVARILSYEPYLSEDNFISGNIQTSLQPQRTPNEDFYISIDDYPGDEYPPHASGSAYVMTIPTALELFQAAQEVKPLLPKEDVFLTGLCAQHIAAPLIHEPSFVIEDPPYPPSWETFSPLAAAHSVTPDILELVWDDMIRTELNALRITEAAINATVLLRMKKSL